MVGGVLAAPFCWPAERDKLATYKITPVHVAVLERSDNAAGATSPLTALSPPAQMRLQNNRPLAIFARIIPPAQRQCSPTHGVGFT